jgi:hypothetical protein
MAGAERRSESCPSDVSGDALESISNRGLTTLPPLIVRNAVILAVDVKTVQVGIAPAHGGRG